MQAINIEKLLEPLSEEAPCGENLEYDSALQTLESTAAVKPVQEFGDTFVPAEAPDWNQVQTLATEILLRTKDVRIAVTYFAHALVCTEGFPGCAKALLLIQGYVEHYWDSVHPQLDADDNFDPLSRINAINALSDSQTIVQSLRRSPLLSAQGIGVFSLRDMDIAAGKITLPKETEAPPTQAIIDGALMDCELSELQKNANAINSALLSIKKIRKCLTDLVGAESASQLNELSTELTQAQSLLDKELSRRGITDELEVGDTSTASARSAVSLGGEINSRVDVIRVLDKICDYYARNEPSSPVPLLLQRVKRLVSMDFMELIKNLASDGIPQVEKIMGVDEKKK